MAVISASLIPLLVNISEGSRSPFLFNSSLRAGVALACLLFLFINFKTIKPTRQMLDVIAVWVFTWPKNRPIILLIIAGSVDYALFAWSTRLLDIAVATILFETWPLFVIFIGAWIFRSDPRFRKVTSATFFLALVSLAGLIFAIASQTGQISNLNVSFYWRSFGGVAVVIAAALAWAVATFGIKWGAELASDLSKQTSRTEQAHRSLELCCAVIALFLTSTLSSVMGAAIGTFTNEDILLESLALALVGGIFLHATASIAWRKANLATDNLGINAIALSRLVLSLIWLFVFSQAEVTRWDYLVIGAAAIITANLLINFEAEIRIGFKAMILALVGCGAIVYLRSDAFSYFSIEWGWVENGYFESATLAATVFTLLLAFRVARLVSRTSEEDSRTFLIYRKLDMLARRGIINPQVCDYLLDIDRANNNSAAEKVAYERARSLIEDVDRTDLNEADSQLLSDAESQLDALARSKQVDIHLGEQFALWIFGSITIGLVLFSLPSNAESGWTRLLVDLFAMLTSTVVIFLLFHIQDLQRERDQQKFDTLGARHAGQMQALVRFLDTQQRSFDQWISLVVGGSIVGTYAVLLFHKWLG